MKLIIDAGTTKTAAAILGNNQERLIISSGINPVTDPNFRSAIDRLTEDIGSTAISEVYYYGSGCINEVVNASISAPLQVAYPVAHIQVHDDLLGACISTSGDASGITVILGTGSNIGYYDGRSVLDGIKSCGYLLGDEGSGYRLGQEIYLRFCRKQLSVDVSALFCDKYNLAQDQAIQTVYQQANPRQYLASFASFIHELSEDEQQAILFKVFRPMIDQMVIPIFTKYQTPVHFVGSIGFHFQKELKSLLEKNDIIAGSFVKSPIDGLIKHHRYEQGD